MERLGSFCKKGPFLTFPSLFRITLFISCVNCVSGKKKKNLLRINPVKTQCKILGEIDNEAELEPSF